jgi:hypothetical protein
MMRFASPVAVRLDTVLFVFTVLLVALPAAADPETAKPPPGCPEPFAVVDVTVETDSGSETLSVEPEIVEIFLKGGEGKAMLVCWRVHGLAAGETLHIEGKEGQPDLFRNLQRTITAPRTAASSGHASAKGSWKYSLWITREGSGEKHLFTDPEVIVRGDGD